MLFAKKNLPIFFKELNLSTKSPLHIKHLQITELGTVKMCSQTMKKQGKHRAFENNDIRNTEEAV